jgi:hypothetical protein
MKGIPQPGMSVRRCGIKRPPMQSINGRSRHDYVEPIYTTTGRLEQRFRGSPFWECLSESGKVEWIQARMLEEV